MNQIIVTINSYLMLVTVILLSLLVLVVCVKGRSKHISSPLKKSDIKYKPKSQARGIVFGKRLGLRAYSPEQDEGHILVLGPSGTGKTSALLIPTLRSWQGTALVVDISGDIAANVNTANKIIFDPT